MPALDNIKWERFCQNIVTGVRKRGDKNTQGRCYITAGYNANGVGEPGGSAEACASKLLKRAKIEERIAELLYEAQQKATQKRAYTIDEISNRMSLASQIAEEERNPSALYGAEKAIAEVRGLIKNPPQNPNHVDFASANTMHEIGSRLLQAIGFAEPDDVSICEALELNATFVAGLEAIRRKADATLQLEADD